MLMSGVSVPGGADDMRSCPRARTLPRAGGRCRPTSGVVAGSSCRLSAAIGTRDRPTTCARGRPLRRRGSGHRARRMAASKSSRSNVTSATIRSSASISTTLRASVWNASGRWSRPEARTRARTRRSPRVAMTSERHVRDADVGERLQICDHGIAAVSMLARTNPRRSIVDRTVVGQRARPMASQSRAAK